MDNANQTMSNEIKSSKQKYLEMRFIWRVGMIFIGSKSPQVLDFLGFDAPSWQRFGNRISLYTRKELPDFNEVR